MKNYKFYCITCLEFDGQIVEVKRMTAQEKKAANLHAKDVHYRCPHHADIDNYVVGHEVRRFCLDKIECLARALSNVVG